MVLDASAFTPARGLDISVSLLPISASELFPYETSLLLSNPHLYIHLFVLLCMFQPSLHRFGEPCRCQPRAYQHFLGFIQLALVV